MTIQLVQQSSDHHPQLSSHRSTASIVYQTCLLVVLPGDSCSDKAATDAEHKLTLLT